MNSETLSASMLVISMERSMIIESRAFMYTELLTSWASENSSVRLNVSSPSLMAPIAPDMLFFTSCRFFIELLYIKFLSQK